MKWLTVLATTVSTCGVKAQLISLDPEAYVSVETSTLCVIPFSLFFLLLYPVVALITSSRIFTILSVNSSWHIFSIFSFISYSTVTVSFNTGFYFTFTHCSCWLQYAHVIIFLRFISWSTGLVSKIFKFGSCWSCKLNSAGRRSSNMHVGCVAAILAVIRLHVQICIQLCVCMGCFCVWICLYWKCF